MPTSKNRGGAMVENLEIITEWIPEQMRPGDYFPLELKPDEVEKRLGVYVAVLACPSCGTLGAIDMQQVAGLIPVICGSKSCSAEFFIKESTVCPRKPC